MSRWIPFTSTQIIPLPKEQANSEGAEKNWVEVTFVFYYTEEKKLCSHLVAKNSTETVKV